MDCSWGFGNNGCDGGEDFRAYSWIKEHGLPSESDYGPYLSQVWIIYILKLIILLYVYNIHFINILFDFLKIF